MTLGEEGYAVSKRVPIDPGALIAGDLRRERTSQGITLETLSAKTGVGIANLHRLETPGQGRVATLRLVLDALEVRATGLPDRSLANVISERCALARQKAERSVGELAKMAGVSRDAVVRLESGAGNLSTLYAVLGALRRTISLRNERAKVWAPGIGDRDSRFTPKAILDTLILIFGPISLDPCWAPGCLVQAKRTFTKEDDGLAQEWWGKFVFVNPPYSNGQAWAEKCRSEFEAGRARTVVALCKSTTYGRTLHDIALTAGAIFLPRAIKFLGPDGRKIGSGAAPFGVVLYIWGASARQIDGVMSAFGGRYLPPTKARDVLHLHGDRDD